MDDLTRKALANKVVVLTDMKVMLKRSKKYQDYDLEARLEDLPYDTILPYDKRMAKRIKNLHKHVFDPDIISRIDWEIKEITNKISKAVKKLND